MSPSDHLRRAVDLLHEVVLFSDNKLRTQELDIAAFLDTVKLLPSKQELWDVQLRNYPDSVELPAQQMFRWADGPERYLGEARSRWRAIALALNQGGGFFYITDPENGFVGYRYGLDGSEYMSGFGQGWPFKLVDGVLMELKGL